MSHHGNSRPQLLNQCQASPSSTFWPDSLTPPPQARGLRESRTSPPGPESNVSCFFGSSTWDGALSVEILGTLCWTLIVQQAAPAHQGLQVGKAARGWGGDSGAR